MKIITQKYFAALLLLAIALPAFAFDASQRITPANAMPVNTESGKATYIATAWDIAPAATATDVFQVCGSATKTIRINYIRASADATAAGSLDFYIFKRTAVNTGGTTSAITPAQMDSNDAAPTATALKYTANPTGLGAGVAVLGDHYAMPAAASTGYPINVWDVQFGKRNDETLVLRGVAQCAEFSMNGQTILAGTSLYVTMEWTEE